MKLLRKEGTQWEYELADAETAWLWALFKDFPIRAPGPVRICTTSRAAATAERENLLKEALAEQRRELKRLAETLIHRFYTGASPCRLLLTTDEREMLLQLLNDIRIACWHALGEPEKLEMDESSLPEPKQKYYVFMQVAGGLQYAFLNTKPRKKS